MTLNVLVTNATYAIDTTHIDQLLVDGSTYLSESGIMQMYHAFCLAVAGLEICIWHFLLLPLQIYNVHC